MNKQIQIEEIKINRFQLDTLYPYINRMKTITVVDNIRGYINNESTSTTLFDKILYCADSSDFLNIKKYAIPLYHHRFNYLHNHLGIFNRVDLSSNNIVNFKL